MREDAMIRTMIAEFFALLGLFSTIFVWGIILGA